MTDFAHPWVLVLAVLTPAAGGALLLWRRHHQRVPAATVVRRFPDGLTEALAVMLSLAGLAAAWVAAAGPRRAAPAAPAPVGLDLVLVLDASGSMGRRGDAGDSRLDEARGVVDRFLDSRKSDRIALVAFARQAAVVAPLTHDHATLRRLSGALAPGNLGRGTALGDALAVALARLSATPRGSGAIVLVSDGLSNAGALDPRTVAAAAAARGIGVDTVAVGGSTPSRGEGPDRLLLRDLAASTGGHYLTASDTSGLTMAFAALSRLRPSPRREASSLTWEDLAHVPAAWAAATLLLAGGLDLAGRRVWG